MLSLLYETPLSLQWLSSEIEERCKSGFIGRYKGDTVRALSFEEATASGDVRGRPCEMREREEMVIEDVVAYCPAAQGDATAEEKGEAMVSVS